MAAGHGAVVYLEIPTSDVDRSVAFYRTVFGWRVRTRGDGSTAFDDGPPESGRVVSGSWRTGLVPRSEAGLLVYLLVDDAHDAVEAIERAGGRIVQAVGGDPGELTARFLDPDGNLLAIYQEPVS